MQLSYCKLKGEKKKNDFIDNINVAKFKPIITQQVINVMKY